MSSIWSQRAVGIFWLRTPPSKYIEFRNRDEQIDFDTKMRQLQMEMSDLLKQEEESRQELKTLFEKLGYNL